MGGWRRRPGPGAPVLALAALVLAAGCSVRIRPDPAPTSIPVAPAAATTTTTGPVSRGTTIASRAFTLVRASWDGSIRPAAGGPLPLAMRRRNGAYADEMVALVLVFPLLRAPPDCVRQVELWLRVLRFDHQFRYQDPQLAAYPSLLVSLASARPAIRAGDETLLDNRPKGDAELTRDEAWMHFEITELYRTWAEGGPFPSQGAPSPRERRWSSTSGRPAWASSCSRLGWSRSAATGRRRPSCAGWRPGTARPAGRPVHPGDDPASAQGATAPVRTAGMVPPEVHAERGDEEEGLPRCSSCRG